jgi:hypothetical protein
MDDLKLLRRPPRPASTMVAAPPLPNRPVNSAPASYKTSAPSAAYGGSTKPLSSYSSSHQTYSTSGYGNHSGSGHPYSGYQGNPSQQYPPPANPSFGHVQRPSSTSTASSGHKTKSKLGKELGKVFKF